MDLQTEIEGLEAQLKKAGVPLDAILLVAGIDRSTWTRWKNGSVKGARYDSIARVRAASAQELSKRERAPKRQKPHTEAQA